LLSTQCAISTAHPERKSQGKIKTIDFRHFAAAIKPTLPTSHQTIPLVTLIVLDRTNPANRALPTPAPEHHVNDPDASYAFRYAPRVRAADL
jgi:hypothetical protein